MLRAPPRGTTLLWGFSGNSETRETEDGFLITELKQSKRYLASYLELHFLPGNMMMYLNLDSSAESYSELLSRNSLFPLNPVEIPSVEGGNDVVYILPTGDTESVQSIGGQLDAATGDPIGNSVTGDPQMVSRTQLGMLDDEQNLQCQGLSLSLNTQMRSAVPGPSSQYQYSNPGLSSVLSHHLPISVEGTISWKGYGIPQSRELTNDECLPSGFTGGNHNGVKTESFCNPQCPVNPKGIHSDSYLYEPSGHTFTICNSKYFKAAQQLLDEVVNVLKALKWPVLDKHQNFHGIGLDVAKETDERSSGQSMLPSMNGISSVQNDTNSSCELSPAEQQDLEDKNTKLLSMLNEVDRRYNQYYHQMQILVSSFDMVAGSGAAKPYTALALQTISRHFRCLRDAISGQIQVTRRSLGEQDTSLNVQGGGIPRLRYVDRQLRQHRALQQLGVMRHAWRPQRGLPESSVSILRAWLFEHFLHPYPKDSDKIMLARQTGLTRSQVANWFINARVRLWKPMVEDMYKEEFGNLEINSKSSPENALKAPKDNFWASEDGGEELQESSTSTAAGGGPLGQFHESKSNLIPDVELKGSTASAGFQNGAHGADDMDCGVMKLNDKRLDVDDCSLYPGEFIPADRTGDGSPTAAAAAYTIPELGDFAVDRQVSLALGLRHCEGDVLTISGGTHNRRDDGAASSVAPDAMDYHCIDPGNQRHRFSNSNLLHDFVV